MAALGIGAFLALFAALFVWNASLGRERARRDDAIRVERERRVRELGWEYDPTHDGDIRYRFRARTPGGVAWEMHYDSDHSSSSSRPRLVWQAADLRTARTELALASRRHYDAFASGTGKKLLGGVTLLFGWLSGGRLGDFNEFVNEARPLGGGSARLRQRFVLAARDARYASLLDASVERLLLDWPRVIGKPFEPETRLTGWLDRNGLRFECSIDGPPMAVCEQLARLGATFADRLRARQSGAA
jgi:hypothetical protein